MMFLQTLIGSLALTIIVPSIESANIWRLGNIKPRYGATVRRQVNIKPRSGATVRRHVNIKPQGGASVWRHVSIEERDDVPNDAKVFRTFGDYLTTRGWRPQPSTRETGQWGDFVPQRQPVKGPPEDVDVFGGRWHSGPLPEERLGIVTVRNGCFSKSHIAEEETSGSELPDWFSGTWHDTALDEKDLGRVRSPRWFSGYNRKKPRSKGRISE